MEDLRPDVRQSIQDRINETNELSGDWQQDEKKGLFKEFKPVEYNIGGSVNDAIGRKAMEKFYDPALLNIGTQQKAHYAAQTQARLQNSQRLGLGQLRYDNARAIAAAQRTAQEEAQRATFIKNLFQGGLAIAGFAAGSPAVGAFAAKEVVSTPQSSSPRAEIAEPINQNPREI